MAIKIKFKMDQIKQVKQVDYDVIVEAIRNIDTTDISDDECKPTSTIIEAQKTFIWTRLYLKEERESEMVPGTPISLKYKDEVLNMKFICYGKANSNRNINSMSLYEFDEDKKVLCFMHDLEVINTSEKIPFLRTLFQMGKHYEEAVFRRDDLKFIIDDTDEEIEYFDIEL